MLKSCNLMAPTLQHSVVTQFTFFNQSSCCPQQPCIPSWRASHPYKPRSIAMAFASPRFRNACESCHKKKTRCTFHDGDAACQPCSVSGNQCLFAPRVKAGRPPSSKRNVISPNPRASSSRGTQDASVFHLIHSDPVQLMDELDSNTNLNFEDLWEAEASKATQAMEGGFSWESVAKDASQLPAPANSLESGFAYNTDGNVGSFMFPTPSMSPKDTERPQASDDELRANPGRLRTTPAAIPHICEAWP